MVTDLVSLAQTWADNGVVRFSVAFSYGRCAAAVTVY
jgi:hypothetical protein